MEVNSTVQIILKRNYQNYCNDKAYIFHLICLASHGHGVLINRKGYDTLNYDN